MLSKQTTDYRYDSAAMLDDPTSVFDTIRQDGDVVWSQTMRRWIVVSRAAVEQALRNRNLVVDDVLGNFERLRGRASVDLDDLVSICRWIPFLHDGPQHEKLRQLFARLLADIKTEYLSAFREVSKDLITQLCEQGGGDLVQDYTDCLHAHTMGNLLGFDIEDKHWLAQNSGSQGSIDFAASIPEMLRANDQAKRIFAVLDKNAGRQASVEFLNRIGLLLTAVSIKDDAKNRMECLAALILLGRDTLSGSLSAGMGHLLEANNGALTAADWTDTGELIEEFIRLSSAVQITVRVATKDIQIASQTIKNGETMMILLSAANQDPQAFVCPHHVDKKQKGHIAYGAGRHLCVGLSLANESIAIALTDLSSLALIKELSGRMIDTGRNTRKFKTFPIKVEF